MQSRPIISKSVSEMQMVFFAESLLDAIARGLLVRAGDSRPEFRTIRIRGGKLNEDRDCCANVDYVNMYMAKANSCAGLWRSV